MLTKRDRKVLEAIEKFKCLSLPHIHKLFYNDVSEKRCRDRMRVLAQQKHVNRNRWHIDQYYTYYTGTRPHQMEHKLMLVDTYIALGTPDIYDLEYVIGNVRADAYTEVIRDDKIYSMFIECQRKWNPFNYEKYETLYKSGEWQEYFHTFPRIIVVSEKELHIESDLKFVYIRDDLSNIEDVFL